MKSYVLNNGLYKDERLSVSRLAGHDSLALIHKIFKDLGDASKASPNLMLLRDINYCVNMLTQQDEIVLCDDCDDDYFDNSSDYASLISFIKSLNKVHPEVNYFGEEDIGDFLSQKSILNVVFHNLIKNSVVAQNNAGVRRGEEVVFFWVAPSGFPDNYCYLPEGAQEFKNFVGFHFLNYGTRFPDEPSFIERLTHCPKSGEGGFGLYFTGLAAKLFRAPVSIHSDMKGSVVSFYHPVYGE